MALTYQSFRLTGVAPIILHNGRTANPLDPWSKALKAISSKRSKTDADYSELARVEWYSSLYQNKEGQIILPAMMLEAALLNGSKKHRLGAIAKAALFVEEHSLLEFDGMNLSVDELWERHQNELTVACRVQNSRIMRTRFIAEEWSAKISVCFESELLNLRQVFDIIDSAGSQVGVGTWRPRHGRFSAETIEAIAAA